MRVITEKTKTNLKVSRSGALTLPLTKKQFIPKCKGATLEKLCCYFDVLHCKNIDLLMVNVFVMV